jgi:P-type Mg2+ transporter
VPVSALKFLHNLPQTGVLEQLQSRPEGLTESEVLKRRQQYGLNLLSQKQQGWVAILFRQVTGNPLILILAGATIVSYSLGQQVSSYYIFAMIVVSLVLGFWNEYFAEKTVKTLLKKVSLNAVVIRNNAKIEVPSSQVTIGDLVLLSPGTVVPADLRLIETQNLEIDQSVLTGETTPVKKHSRALHEADHDLNDLTNVAFMGTVVSSGSATGVVIAIGQKTEFGKIPETVSYLKPVTSFQKGLTNYGNLLIRIVAILTIAIFGFNSFLGKPLIESFLFALAIAVGLTPELLPVVVTVSLSHGAGRLAKRKVLIKQLVAIENLGNMDILCTDKTGTLTEGKLSLVNFIDKDGQKKLQLLPYSLLCNNAVIHHKIIGNSFDKAIWEYHRGHPIEVNRETKKIFEEPFDYEKKLMFSVVSQGKQATLITKGAPESVIRLCPDEQQKLLRKYQSLSGEGYSVIALATKEIAFKDSYTWHDADNLKFEGFLVFLDAPKKSAKAALEKLQKLHVEVKVLTGDNQLVAKMVCQEVGMDTGKIILGEELNRLSDKELQKVVAETNIFARVSPRQKLRIVQTLQKLGHTVGFMGDGINDVPSLHSADIGISVNDAVDVAKNTASVVCLQKSLDVIADGVTEGRKTFNNTLKYIMMSTGSNFGEMVSAAGASFFLPFLPMSPVQILLEDGLYDISQLVIASDNVDPEMLIKPKHLDISFIKNYMLFFGSISALYTLITFIMMSFVFHAPVNLFQTAWFIESLVTEIAVVFVIRTVRSPFFNSRPGKWLAITSLLIILTGLILPFTPLAQSLGFTTLPPLFFILFIILISSYLLILEVGKKLFLKQYQL